jgi:hypothetical protein
VLKVVGKIYSKLLAFSTKLHGITSTVVNIYVCTVNKELSLLIRCNAYKIDESEIDSPGQHINQLQLNRAPFEIITASLLSYLKRLDLQQTNQG